MSSGDTTTPTPPPAGGNTPGANGNATKQRTMNNLQGSNNVRSRGNGNSGNATFRISNFKGEVSKVGAVIGTK